MLRKSEHFQKFVYIHRTICQIFTNLYIFSYRQIRNQIVELKYKAEVFSPVIRKCIILKPDNLLSRYLNRTRIRIIEILLSGEISVNEIAEKLQLGQSAVSHQLRILRTAGLVKPRRVGRTVFYALDDEHIGLIFNTGLAHIMHKKGV